MDPRELKDAKIVDVIVESDARVLLHLRDGRAVAFASEPTDYDGGTAITLEHVNPGGQAT